MSAAGRLIACHECDLLQREIALPAWGAARCARCAALLYRYRPGCLERALAYVLAAALLFVIANAFPIVEMEVSGSRSSATLFGAVRALHAQSMTPVAALVFVTTLLVPAAQLAAFLYLLLPVRVGRVPRHAAAVLRLVQALKPWGMVEVFVLGVLVSLVKLAHMAHVVPGVAMWSFAGLMLLFAAAAVAFDARALWQRVRPWQ